MAYGQLPQYQSASNPAPVAAQQIALANAQASGVPVTTTAIVPGGGPGMMQAPSDALAVGALKAGVSIDANGNLIVNGQIVANGSSSVQTAAQPVASSSLPSGWTAATTAASSTSMSTWLLIAAAAAGAYFLLKG
jgi:hypothetical protein